MKFIKTAVIILFIFGQFSLSCIEKPFDYSIEQKRICFCPYNDTWVKLYIKSDSIIRGYNIETNRSLSINALKFFWSIRDINSCIDTIDKSKYDIRVILDSSGTFPTRFYYDRKNLIEGNTVTVFKDCGATILNRNYIEY